MSTHQHVAIIGAGLAGLSCATALQAAGVQVTLFEKSKGVSGRVSTRASEHWQCDHGAQYFTARDALFHQEVKRWTQQGVAKVWQPSLGVFDGHHVLAKETDANILRFVGYPKNNAPANWLAQTLKVMCEATVIGIHKQGATWRINTIEHGVYAESFDDVILAMPAPQAATLLKDTASHLFKVCDAVIMRPCFALMVQFHQTVPSQFDGLFIQSGILSWAARDSAKPGRQDKSRPALDVWVLHATAAWSALHVNDDKGMIAQTMLVAFHQILKRDTFVQASNHVFDSPQSYSLHRWLYADCETYLMDVCLYDDAERIGICGDWVNGGKVQGAWLSGLHLANRLISKLASR